MAELNFCTWMDVEIIFLCMYDNFSLKKLMNLMLPLGVQDLAHVETGGGVGPRISNYVQTNGTKTQIIKVVKQMSTILVSMKRQTSSCLDKNQTKGT